MNWRAVQTIFNSEMKRFFRTIGQSMLSPVLSTILYFIVFGAAIGGRIQEVEGIQYGAFIVPGLMMLTVLQQSLSNASFGIYFPKFTGTIFELFTAPISFVEILLGYVGAAAAKAMIIAFVILITATFFVDLQIAHPFWALGFLTLTAVSFSLLGFIIGIWAKNFEQLQIIPMLVVTPLVFLGGAFYSADMLPGFWETVVKFNPVLYLISGFRWSFFEVSDVPVGISLLAITAFLTLCLGAIAWIFKTGWRLKQ
jgi:ABC-2 type transport system permease protein